MGRRDFPPKSPPSYGKLCFFSFLARNFYKCQGAALGQTGLENQSCTISRPCQSGGPKHKMLKSCAISGRNFWGGWISPPKVRLALRNCVFLFPAPGPNFSECPWAKTPVNHRFRPRRGPTGKTNCYRESCGKLSRIAW